MSLEMSTSFQLSTISTVRASLSQNSLFISSKEKLVSFPAAAAATVAAAACRGSRTSSLPTSTSSFSRSVNSKCRNPTIVCKAGEAVNQVTVVNDASWNNLVMGSKSPVLVEFWAPWCGPCRMIAPVIDELAKEYAGKIVCFKLNTDESPTIATKYGIRSIPTVLFFKNGEKKESVIGAVPKSTLTATVEKYLEM